MNDKTEGSTSSIDYLKWGVVAILIAGGVVGNNYYADQSVLYRVLALLALALVAVAIAFQTVQGAAFWNLIKEARTEIRKVVWPSRQETTQTTLIVLVVVLIAAVILWLLDMGLGWIMSYIIG